MESVDTSVVLLQRFQSGDPGAADALYHRYARRLTALARSRLIASLNSRVDAEDVTQSAFHDFFQQVAAGQVAIGQAGELWRLLAAIAMHKLYRQVKRHGAAKRDWRRTVADAGEISHAEPSVLDQLILAEELQLLLGELSTLQRRAVEMRLAGAALAEIAEALGRSERTIRRWMDQWERQLQQQWAKQSALVFADRVEQPETSPFSTTECSIQQLARGAPSDGELRYTDYRLRRLIGSGGMGKVYLASEIAKNRMVAVKSLHKSLLVHAPIVEQFVGEARLVSQWQHPHIATVHGWGRMPVGGLFIVIQLVDGPDFGVAVSRGLFNQRQVFERLVEVASAVAFAHGQGVVHCDLKPGNVLCDPANGAQVVDFGLATLIKDHDHQRLRRDFIAGTAGFMAPEQIDQQLASISAATDVYGFGALMFAVLTGRPPFHAGTAAEVFAAVLKKSPPPWPENLPRLLVELGRRCLSKDPSGRPSMSDVIACLSDLIR